MKQLLSRGLIALLFLAACNNDKKATQTVKNEDGSTTTTSVDVKAMSTAADDMNKKMEDLKKLTPLTLEQLKALLPEELNGIKQTNYNSSTAMGYAFAEGEYQKNDTTELKVMLYDCAGESGSAWYATSYWGLMNFQQESTKEYTKTIDFMGAKAVENYKKDRNESSLTYVASDRLLVVLTGRNMNPDELKDAAQKLNLKIS